MLFHTHPVDSDLASSVFSMTLTPGFRFIKFPSTYITVDLEEATCVSQDGLRVLFSVTFQYQLPVDWVLPVVLKYRDFANWEDVVTAAGGSAVGRELTLPATPSRRRFLRPEPSEDPRSLS